MTFSQMDELYAQQCSLIEQLRTVNNQINRLNWFKKLTNKQAQEYVYLEEERNEIKKELKRIR